MSTTTTRNAKTIGVLSLVIIVFGAIFFVAGAVTWGAVAHNLKAENITVSADADAFGGQLVDTPWEAFSQAAIINHHALTATGGQTYAEIGVAQKALEAKLTEAGKSADEIKADPDYAKLTGLRTTVMNGSFLRASLFTSVIAFGVALLVMGLGVVLALVGFAIRKLVPATDVVAPAVDANTGEALLV